MIAHPIIAHVVLLVLLLCRMHGGRKRAMGERSFRAQEGGEHKAMISNNAGEVKCKIKSNRQIF